MSKRAGTVPEETKANIISAARNEFYENGYDGTSLRKICAAAGVTTGAVYFFFDGKEDLFDAVINEVIKPLSFYMKKHYAEEDASLDRTREEIAKDDYEAADFIIDFYFDNRKTFDIILKHLTNAKVEEAFREFIETSAAHYEYMIKAVFMGEKRANSVDSFDMNQFVHMQIGAILTLISSGCTKEEMHRHSKTVTKMMRGAFYALCSD